MALTIKSSKEKKETATPESFYTYIKKQHQETTFNGSKVKKFSWYKKVLGLL